MVKRIMMVVVAQCVCSVNVGSSLCEQQSVNPGSFFFARKSEKTCECIARSTCHKQYFSNKRVHSSSLVSEAVVPSHSLKFRTTSLELVSSAAETKAKEHKESCPMATRLLTPITPWIVLAGSVADLPSKELMYPGQNRSSAKAVVHLKFAADLFSRQGDAGNALSLLAAGVVSNQLRSLCAGSNGSPSLGAAD